MKKYIITLLLSFSITTGFSQDVKLDVLSSYVYHQNEDKSANRLSEDLMFEIHGAYTHPVIKEKLIDAKTLNDIIPGYPANWFKDYVSAEILTTSNGKSSKAMSKNEILSTEQKSLLTHSEHGTDITIDVKYKSKNSATEIIEIRTMKYSVTVIPEVEAEYFGGQKQLINYIKQNVTPKISADLANAIQAGTIRFTINEAGEIINAHITRSFKNDQTDKLILDVISNMPRWKPAENSKGVKVKQDFVFKTMNTGC